MNRTREIHDELLKAAPKLIDISMENGYLIPEGYFELLPDIIWASRDAKDNEVKVDKHYFSKMQDEVMTKISKIEQPARVVKFTPWAKTLSFAASMILIFAVGFLMLQKTTGISSNEMAMEISTEDAIEYIGNNIEDIDINTMIESGMFESEMLTDQEIYLDEADMNEADMNEIIDELSGLNLQELEDII